MIKEDDKYVIHGLPPLEPLPNISLGKVLYESLLANPNKHDALVDAVTRESISYKQLLGMSCSLAESLSRTGYGKDAIISVSSENNLQFFIPVISGLFIGAIVAPLNHNYTDRECVHCLDIYKPQLMFCSRAVCQKYVNLKSGKLPFIERIIIIDSDDEVPGTQSMNNFIKKNLGSGSLLYRFNLTEIDPKEQVAFVMCSSGTTGLPKAVMQTHSNLITRYMHVLDPRVTMKAECIYGLLPFFHGFGFVTNLFGIIQDEVIVVLKKFQEEQFFKHIEEFKISTLFIPPPIFLLFAKSTFVNKYDLSCIKEICCGAAPLSGDTEVTVKRRLRNVAIRQGYGLTEATLAVTTGVIGDQKFGSCGKVVPYMSCKVRNPETGNSLGPGQVGEICIKGPLVMKGYYNNEEATRNSFTSDGWLLTGDLAYYDEDQCFHIVDRQKELLKYKGFQVSPAELEAVVLSNPKVKDVGIVGVPDEVAGELPLAFVVKNPNEAITEREIIEFVAERVSSQKRLRGGVIFVSAIPKSPSGKILRRELRKMLNSFKSKL